MTRGDTLIFDVTITRSGTPVDITNAAVWCTAKRRTADADSGAVFQLREGSGITKTNPTQGVARCTVAPSDTSSLASETVLVYDVQIRESNGVVSTVVQANIFVGEDVTRATG